MTEIIQSIWISLDGVYEGPEKWDLNFNSLCWGPEAKRIADAENRTAGGLLLGRRTYDGFAENFPKDKSKFAAVLNALPKYVVSKTLKQAAWKNTTIISTDVVRAIKRLKAQTGKPLFIFGSGELASTLTKHGLIDEYRLLLTPVVVGAGTPLFKPGPRALAFRLVSTHLLKTGGIVLTYRPKKTKIKLRE
ncbi:MAG: dihydrofolate reductase family protein [Thermoplasmata archaeon]|jgi:dihydrofolate reductase